MNHRPLASPFQRPLSQPPRFEETILKKNEGG